MAEGVCGDACRNEHEFNVTEGDVMRTNQITWTVMHWSTLQNSFTGRNDKQDSSGKIFFFSCVPSYVGFEVLHCDVDKVECILALR